MKIIPQIELLYNLIYFRWAENLLTTFSYKNGSAAPIFFYTPCVTLYSVQQAATQKSFQKNSISDFPKLQDSTMDKKDVECP